MSEITAAAPMTGDAPAAATPPPADDGLTQERRTTPLELLWDLVFVFAVTQVTTLLSHRLGWAGFGQALLVLALIWWAWSAFVWAANAQTSGSSALRMCLLVSTVCILITGLALPQAYAGEGPLFAISYAIVRGLHLALYADASRKGDAAWSAIAGFALTVAIGMALLVAGAFVSGTGRAMLWLAAAAIDYAGPAWLTRERLRGLQRVAVAHFAERYGLFVLICLGESIVGIGLGARRESLSAAVVVSVGLELLITIGLWWTYFDRAADAAERRLRRHEDPVLAAADAYSYLHLIIVAGIIIFAVGASDSIRATGASLAGGPRLALCGGVALYLIGLVLFRLRLLRSLSVGKVLAAVALMALYAVGGGLPAWSVAAGVAVLLGGLCASESLDAASP